MTFGKLEPRQLLAGDIDFSAPQFSQVDTGIPDELNLVVNGDFSTATSGDAMGMFDQANVAGWSVSDALGGQKINLLNVAAGSRGNVLELDSTGAIFDSVFQDIDTLSEESYLLSFELRERPNGDTGLEITTNDVSVFWDGTELGTFRGISHWQTITLSVTGGATDFTTLEFREVVDGSVGSEGKGPMIDNVRVVNVTNMNMANGSFETVPDGIDDDAMVAEGDLANWFAYGADGFRNFNVLTNTNTVTPDNTDGDYYVNLDASANNVDRIYQELATTPGAQYYLTFDLLARSDKVTTENELRVRWNNEWAGTFNGNTNWQSFGLLVDADAANTKVVFREPGGFIGDGQGPLIDNVQLFMVDNVTADLVVDLNGNAAGNDFTADFVENSGEVSIVSSSATLSNNGGSNLSSVVVDLKNEVDTGLETLAVDLGTTSISANFANSRLTLSGDASVEDYQTVLRTLTYDNTSGNPDDTSRVVDITLFDGSKQSEKSTVTISISKANDSPIVEPISSGTVKVDSTFTAQATATDTDDDDASLVYDISYVGDAIGTGDNEPTISNTGLVSWTPSRSGFITVTVSATDDDGAVGTTSFNITADISGDVPGDFIPFSGTRQLSNVTPALRDEIYTAAPAMTIDDSMTYTATIETADGDIVLDLFATQAPLAVNNFVNLANDGYFDGLTFHRVLEGFVAQGGDPLGTGTGGPGYTFADEFDASLRFNGAGVLAMANSGPSSNGSQFFITYGSQPHLNDLHTIFGSVASGQDIVDAITKRVPGDATPSEIIYSVTIAVT